MPIPSNVIPVLFPFWARADHILKRPLVSPEVTQNGPVVGYMVEKNGQVVPIDPGEGEDWEALDQAALQYLRQRPGEWKSEELELDTGQSRLVLACEDDPFACARLIDPDFLGKAHEILQSHQLIVSIPVQGVLFATRADLAGEDVLSYAELIHKAYTDSQYHPVSPILFLMENCEITSALAGVEAAATPVQRPLPYTVNKIQSTSGEYNIEISVKKTPPISSRISELVRLVEKTIVAESEMLTFTGRISLVINTGSGQRSADQEVHKEIRMLQARLNRLVAKNGWLTMRGMPVTVEVIHIQPEDPNATLEKRSTGSLTGTLLQSPDPAERARSAEILGLRADQDAVRPLVAALEDEDESVRQTSMQSLLRINEAAVPYLEYFAENASIIGRANAISTLRQIDAQRFLTLYLRSVTHPDAEVREQAALGLSEIQDEALEPTMMKLLHDDFSPIRQMAVRWLSAFQADWALDGLIDALDDLDDDVRLEARQAIIARGKSVTETLRARRKMLDRNLQPELYGAVSEVIDEVGGGGFFNLFKRLLAA